MLKKSKERVYVLSYDDSSITKSDVTKFLLQNKVRNIESYTDSTIHFEWNMSNCNVWFGLIKKTFPKMVFSINLIAHSADKQFYEYTENCNIETNFKYDILEPLKKELGVNF